MKKLKDVSHQDAQFYARADNLNEWLSLVEKRLGSLSQRLSAARPLVRINTDLAGNLLTDETIGEQKNRDRQFVLFSLGLSHEFSSNFQVFTNLSQNYRAINFNDLRITNTNFRVDPNLQDETGYNADIGIRGMWKDLMGFDISAFYLKYNNRIGFSLKTDERLFNTYRFRSNISASRNIGVESLIQINLLKCSLN